MAPATSLRGPRAAQPRLTKLMPKASEVWTDKQCLLWTVTDVGPPAPHDRDRRVTLRGEGPMSAPLSGPVKSITLATLQRCYRRQAPRR
jgi:hypothetical protein